VNVDLVLQARELSKRFYLRHNRIGSVKEHVLGWFHRDKREVLEEFWALRGVNLEIRRGEAVGLIGSNGSGKSTLLKLIAGIHKPTTGTVRVAKGARVGTMIELGVGFHPELTGEENVFLSASVHGMTRSEIEAIYGDIVEYAGLHQFMDTPLKNYSSGMQMRLGFAVSAQMSPDLLLLDEIFAVGDAEFQRRCVATIREFQDGGGTIVFVSHSPDAVRTMCGRACLMERGRLIFDGAVESAFGTYAARILSAQAENRRRANSAAADGDATPARTLTAQDEARTEVLVAEVSLTPGERVLHIAHPPLGGEVELRGRCGRDNYTPLSACWDTRELLGQIANVQGPFDLIIADGLWPEMTLTQVALSIVEMRRLLAPAGRLLVTAFEQPEPLGSNFVTRPSGAVTSIDQPPYHQAWRIVESICCASGTRAERVTSLPTGEVLIRIQVRDDTRRLG
jgi:ABC-type polysaccharide/polyol phosphate transport system ATPase subunit